MEIKHKNKRIIVKIVSVFMLVFITALAVCVPCSALITVDEIRDNVEKSSFPLNVSLVYDYGVSVSSNTLLRPYSFDFTVGENTSIMGYNDDVFDYDSFEDVNHRGMVEYGVEVEEYRASVFFGSFVADSYVKLGHIEYDINALARRDDSGVPQDILQKVCFSADTIYYNPNLLLCANTVSSPEKPYVYGLPYVELQTPLSNHSMINDYFYKCSFDVTTNYGLREHIEYTKSWRGAWLDDNNLLYLIEPDEIRKYSGVDTIAIENFESELTYTILIESQLGDVSTTTPHGCWKLDNYVSNSELAEFVCYGDFLLSHIPMQTPDYDNAENYDNLRFNDSHTVVCGYVGDIKVSDLYSLYQFSGERYLYVNEVTNKEHEDILLNWLINHANYVPNSYGGSADTNYSKANILYSGFDTSTQRVKLVLPIYDTSHVASYDKQHNSLYQLYYSYPNFEKFMDTYNYRHECSTTDSEIDIANFSFTNWLGNAVGNFFSIEIFPNFTLGGLLGILVSFSLVLILLRWIGG